MDGCRSQGAVIAGNGNTTCTFQMLHCRDNETLSDRLYNARNMRVAPTNWNNPGVEHYNWFSNTEYTSGAESFDFAGYALLENALCCSVVTCKPQSQGGTITKSRSSAPQREGSGSMPEKYMYFRWEDRPRDMGWTGHDYEDIRIIVECPAGRTPGQMVVRLIQSEWFSRTRGRKHGFRPFLFYSGIFGCLFISNLPPSDADFNN